jgi:hypothetical protein
VLNAKIDALSEKFDALKSDVNKGFQMVATALESATLRAENESLREIGSLRERVTRIEDRIHISLPQ